MPYWSAVEAHADAAELEPKEGKAIQIPADTLNIQQLLETNSGYRIFNNRFREEKWDKRIKHLLGFDHEWVIFFKLQLLGEYVIEILFELDKHINDNNINQYKYLIFNNIKYWEQTKSRVTSYWNEYYRYPNYKK